MGNIKMDAQLSSLTKMREELQYLSGCLIYFHYKVYKRVQKRKKEEAAKKKKKNAKKGKGKKKGTGLSTTARPTVATPAKPAPSLQKTTSTTKKLEPSKSLQPDSNLSATMALPKTDKLGESGVGAPEQEEDKEEKEENDSAGEFDRSNSIVESALNNDDPITINTPQNPDLGEIKEQPDGEEIKENTSVMDVEARSGVASRGEEVERTQPIVTILDSTGKESLMGME